MSTNDDPRERFGELNSEHGLLLLFIAASAYMFVEAQSWSFDSKVFPQSMSAAIIIGSVLILVQDYLPEPLRKIVAGTGSAFEQTEELDEEIESESDEEGGAESDDGEESPEFGPGHDRPLNPVLATGILMALYVGAGYLFSLFLVTPFFVAAYLVWFRQPWPIVVGLSLLGLAIAYLFATLIIVPVDRGVIVGDLLTIGGVI